MCLSKLVTTTAAVLVAIAAPLSYAATEPMYLNYPLQQRSLSNAPSYLPELGLSQSAGQLRNGYIEPQYLNYRHQAGKQPVSFQYTGDRVPYYK